MSIRALRRLPAVATGLACLAWLLPGGATAAPPRPRVALPNTAVVVSVDLTAGRHPISDDIYGMNFADDSFARDIASPVDRWGGNSIERYNWQAGTTSLGNDYYFENVADCFSSAQQWCGLPNHTSFRSATAQFDADRARGASPVVTLPMLGYVAKTPVKYDHPLDCGYPRSVVSSASYDPYDSDCGNGRTESGAFASGAHPSLTSTAIAYDAFDGAWIDSLKARYGSASAGGIRFYELGNEPSLWYETHHDVRDTRLGFDEEYAKASSLAAVVKAHDAGAKVLGPSDWGWLAYFCSDADDWDHGCSPSSPDRAAHGGAEFAAWYLAKFRAAEQAGGIRLLDYFDEHYYPQGGTTPDITRSLWDPTYTDPSWIGATIDLIPRMKAWVAANYPGTKIALGEYDFGNHATPLGAVLQADVLGILGREGVDLATMWNPPASTEPAAFAFRMYRNYDGRGSRFGQTGVRAITTDQSVVAAYAAQRSSDGAATVVLVNKTAASLPVTFTIAGSHASTVAEYQYAGGPGIVALPRVPVAGGSAGSITGVAVLPPMSLTTLVA